MSEHCPMCDAGPFACLYDICEHWFDSHPNQLGWAVLTTRILEASKFPNFHAYWLANQLGLESRTVTIHGINLHAVTTVSTSPAKIGRWHGSP